MRLNGKPIKLPEVSYKVSAKHTVGVRQSLVLWNHGVGSREALAVPQCQSSYLLLASVLSGWPGL